MKGTLLNRILLTMLLAITVSIVVAFATAFLSSYREHQELQKREERLAKELQKKKEEHAYSQEYIDQMMKNPEFLEHVAREKLGYAKPEEKIIRLREEENK